MVWQGRSVLGQYLQKLLKILVKLKTREKSACPYRALSAPGRGLCSTLGAVVECRLFDPAQFYPCDLRLGSRDLSVPNKEEERLVLKTLLSGKLRGKKMPKCSDFERRPHSHDVR